MRIKILAGMYAILLLAIVILAGLPQTRYIFEGVRALPGGDKTGHFLLMGMLSFVLNLAFSRLLQARGRSAWTAAGAGLGCGDGRGDARGTLAALGRGAHL